MLTMSQADEPKSKGSDLLFVHSPSEEGKGFNVIRKRSDTIEFGELRALEEGRPIHGEVVALAPRAEHERLFDVEVLMPKAQSQEAAGRSGPPQVATEAYRSNWENIFGQGPDPSEPN